MATEIILPFEPPEGHGSTRIVVQEPFEEVLNISIPLQQASSALEARHLLVFTKLNGKRVYMTPQHCAIIAEIDVTEEEEDEDE